MDIYIKMEFEKNWSIVRGLNTQLKRDNNLNDRVISQTCNFQKTLKDIDIYLYRTVCICILAKWENWVIVNCLTYIILYDVKFYTTTL